MNQYLISSVTRAFVACSLSLLIAACASPDIKPFSEQTANLAAAVRIEQKAISIKFEEVIDLTREENKKKFKDEMNQFNDSSKALNALFDQAVDYSSKLVELAEAGEKGSDAAKSLLDTASKLGNLTGLFTVNPAAIITEAFDKIAKIVTRIQAQRSLADATIAVDPAVQAVAEAVDKIYNDAQKKLDTALKNEMIGLLADQAGVNLIGLHRDTTKSREAFYSGLRQSLQLDAAKKSFCISEKGEDDPNCRLANNIQAMAALNSIVQTTESAFLSYDKQRREQIRWREERKEKAILVVKATKLWAQEHQKLTQVLQKCGGLRFYKCQEINAHNIKSIIDQLKHDF